MSMHARQLPNDAHERIGTIFAPDARSIPPTPPERSPERSTDRTPERTPERTPAPRAPDLPWYRKERWLAVQLLALIPILGAMFAPAAYRAPMCIVGGALIAIGTVMMLRHHQSSARQQTSEGAESR